MDDCFTVFYCFLGFRSIMIIVLALGLSSLRLNKIFVLMNEWSD